MTVRGVPQVVRELWHNRAWNVELLGSLFSHGEVDAIRRMQVPLFDSVDKWAWHYSKDGEYTARSAYYMLLKEEKDSQASSSKNRRKFEWVGIWGANLPPKIKHFAWRAVNEGLAVSLQLVKRGVELKNCCYMCGEGEESVLNYKPL